jgi:hypothetical protein
LTGPGIGALAANLTIYAGAGPHYAVNHLVKKDTCEFPEVNPQVSAVRLDGLFPGLSS